MYWKPPSSFFLGAMPSCDSNCRTRISLRNAKTLERVLAVLVAGVYRQRAAVIGNRLLAPPQLLEEMAHLVQQVGIIWVALDDAVVVGDGPVVLALHDIGEATVVIGVRIFGVELNGAGAIGDGPAVVALVLIGDAAVVIGDRQFRVE